MQKTRFFTVDLTKTKGKGEFNCPKCGIEISPDDMTEDRFTVLDTIMKGDRTAKIILKCNRCGSQIHLIGFHLLDKVTNLI
ncbi:MAG: hypothetical protein OEY24_07345 [Candidatus Bathyarchaeota archaeon]|nr:hypothetical protein [Candidatus Bathyarchaeota archaeon]